MTKLVQQVNEIAALKALADAGKKIVQTAKSAVSSNAAPTSKPQQKQQEPADTADSVRGMTSDMSDVANIVSELMQPPGNVERLVIFLSHGDLRNLYLKAGGGADLIDTLSREQISSIVQHGAAEQQATKPNQPAQSAQAPEQQTTQESFSLLRNVVLEADNPQQPAAKAVAPQMEQKTPFRFIIGQPKFSQIINPTPFAKNADRAVIINLPKGAWAKLRQTADPASLLKSMMSLKYYKMTLNLTKARTFAKAMQSAGQNVDKMSEVFDPRALENYPVKATWRRAIDEWNSQHSDEARLSKKEQTAELKDREKKVDSHLSQLAAGTPEADLKKTILDIVSDPNIAKTGDPESMRSAISDRLKKAGLQASNKEIANVLDELEMSIHALKGRVTGGEPSEDEKRQQQEKLAKAGIQ